MRRFFFAVVLSILLIAPAAWSQQLVTSTVRGTVRDQSQSVVPGATITLTSTGTNVSRNTVTDSAGVFSFPGNSPGPYRLTAEFSGMAKFEGNLTVRTSTDETIDIVMTVATQASTVQVTDITPALVTDSDTLSQTLNRDGIVQTVTLGRGYQDLMQTVPGMIYSTHGHDVGGRALGYGLQTGSTYITMDGNPMQEENGGWDFPRLPDVDAIEEVHVETSDSSARYSKPTTIVFSSRAGTNGLHGSLFYDARNSAIMFARQRQDPSKVPFQNREEYGVAGGGPIIIPKLYNGKNKTFWFWDWEGTRSLVNSTQQLTVPTTAMANGDFSGLTTSSGQAVNIYNPYTTDPTTFARQQFNYGGQLNHIDPALESPTAKLLFAMTRPPNQPGINPALGNNWIGPAPRPLQQDSYSLRLDHHISDRDLIYGRYGYNKHYECLNSGFAVFYQIFNNYPTSRECRYWPNHEFSTTWTHTFSPTTTMEVQATATRDQVNNASGYDHGYPVDYAGYLGLPNPFVGPKGNGNGHTWPPISVGTSTGSVGTVGGYAFPLSEGPNLNITEGITFADNITKVVGTHELGFGFQYRWYDLPKGTFSSSEEDTNTLASSQFNPSSTLASPSALGNTGANLVNLYLGQMNYTADFQRPVNILRKTNYAGYIQDHWRTTPRLTINLGLRWDMHTPMKDKLNQGVSFDLKNHAYVLAAPVSEFLARGATLPSLIQGYTNLGGVFETPAQAGVTGDLYNTNYKQFGPRLGFAYRALDGKKAFVLRGGFAISYYQETIGNIWSAYNPQFTAGQFTNSVTNTALSPDGFPSYGLRSRPTIVAGVNSTNSIVNVNNTSLLVPGTFTATRINPNLPDPKVYEWNLTMEKEIMPQTVLRATYRGNHTVNQSGTVSQNSQPSSYVYELTNGVTPPTGSLASVANRPYDQKIFGNVGELDTYGLTWYNGMEFSIQRQFSHDFSFQWFYDMANAFVQSGSVNDLSAYLPGAVPTDVAQRARFLNYHRDITVSHGGGGVGTPKHQISWNFTYNLPFGRGKKFANNNKFLDLAVGGWQLNGIGYLVTSWVTLPTSTFPNGSPLNITRDKYRVQDCSGGTGQCFPAYLWYNGYISPKFINSVDANGAPNGVEGLPSGYTNASQPLIPYGQTALPANAPANTVVSSFWDTNTVWLPLKNGTVVQNTFGGLAPWNNVVGPILGPWNWYQDASVAKTYRIKDRLSFRLEIRGFNVLNSPNDPTSITASGSTIGLLSVRNSGAAGNGATGSARQFELAGRFSW